MIRERWALLPCAVGVALGVIGGAVHFWNGDGHAAGWALNSAWWAGTAGAAVWLYGPRGRA